MSSREFGRLADGGTVECIAIAAGELRVEVLTFGAAVRDARLEGHHGPLVLGFDGLGSYLAHSPYFGAIAGRFANRIGHGRFTLDGATYQLDLNENGRTHLHGGSRGFSFRNWSLADAAPEHVSFKLVSDDGDMGYPGMLAATCTYRVVPPATLRVDLGAATDRPTIVNLAQHSYFNLDGSTDIAGHRLTIAADRVTAVDDDLIPTGELVAVDGTAYDFRAPRPIGSARNYDINFCLREDVRALAGAAARLESPVNGLALEVWTTEPGLQFYDGHMLDVTVPGLEGRRYGRRAGLCLEAQRWPDAPNHPHFPFAVLRPGAPYAQVTEFRFSRA